MKEKAPAEKLSEEILLSIALVRDIIFRHFNAKEDVTTTDCQCGICMKKIPRGVKSFFVTDFKKISSIACCDRDCVSKHQQWEMGIFGCEKIEEIPFLEHKGAVLNSAELQCLYCDRLTVSQPNFLAINDDLQTAYQLVANDS